MSVDLILWGWVGLLVAVAVAFLTDQHLRG